MLVLVLWLGHALQSPPAGVTIPARDRGKVVVARSVESSRGCVVCVDHYAAEVGAQVLAEGGNAVDAAVATLFALAVTHPPAGNLGGGGFLLAGFADGRVCAIDYRETAPALATDAMFLDDRGEIDPEKSGIGYRVIGVPGTVAGLELAHELFGSLPWSRLVRPARDLAGQGIVVDADLCRAISEGSAQLRQFASTTRCFFHPDGSAYAAGELWRQPDLARSLQWIEEEGSKAFYRGPIAALIEEEMLRGGGLVRRSDLEDYRPRLREPIRVPVRGYEVLSMPPPSSGGITLAQILRIVDPWLDSKVVFGSALHRHLMAEAQRRAFALRAHHLGDPDATLIDGDWLTSAELGDRMRRSIRFDQASRSDDFGPAVSEQSSAHTTHLSVVDRLGNAVSNTYTLEDSFGSKVVAEGTGFLLNNELHDFNLRPDWTDRKGNIGTPPNLARPGRRPLSSMTPVIVRRGTRPVLVTGSPGGRSIISTVAWILVARLCFDLPLQECVLSARQHHQWFPDVLQLEPEVTATVECALQALGHTTRRTRQGDAHSIEVAEKGRVLGVADRRIDGWAAAPGDG